MTRSWSGTTQWGRDRSRRESFRRMRSEKNWNCELAGRVLKVSASHLSAKAISLLIRVDCVIRQRSWDLLLNCLSRLSSCLASFHFVRLLLLLLSCDGVSSNLLSYHSWLDICRYLFALKKEELVISWSQSDAIFNLRMTAQLSLAHQIVQHRRSYPFEYVSLSSLLCLVHFQFHQHWSPKRCCWCLSSCLILVLTSFWAEEPARPADESKRFSLLRRTTGLDFEFFLACCWCCSDSLAQQLWTLFQSYPTTPAHNEFSRYKEKIFQ